MSLILCLDGRLFTTLILFSESFSSQFVMKMEDRIADVVEEMAPSDMVSVSVPAINTFLHGARNILFKRQKFR
jgi:hypothetical protein